MSQIKRIILLVFLTAILLLSTTLYSQTPFNGCKAQGEVKKTAANPTSKLPTCQKELNVEKNRAEAPTASQVDTSITINNILNPKKLVMPQTPNPTARKSGAGPPGRSTRVTSCKIVNCP